MPTKATRIKNREIATACRQVLASAFPDCFAAKGQPKRPLKIGIYADIRAALPYIKGKALNLGLHDYTSGPIYLRAMTAGAERIALDGSPAGVVTEEQAQIAAERLDRINAGIARRRRLSRPEPIAA